MRDGLGREDSAAEMWQWRRRRPGTVVMLVRDLTRRGVVLSLWRDSCGWWRMSISVLVAIGSDGMTWQMQIGFGRSQLLQI